MPMMLRLGCGVCVVWSRLGGKEVESRNELGDKMVLNDFIRVAATMHARGLEPEPEKKKKEKEEKV